MAEDDPTTGAAKRPRTRRKAAAESVAPDVTGPGVAPASPGVAEDGASLEADRVEMRLSAVGRVEAGQLTVDRGAVGAARADAISIDRGVMGAAIADRVDVSRGYARSILARQVQIEQAGAQVVIAADVHATNAAVMFLVARRVTGDVKVLFDWRGALAFGAAAGLIVAIASRLRRRPG